MKIILGILWIGVGVSVCIAAVILVGGMATAGGAPQEAVVCALAVAVAVLPYVFTRAVEGFFVVCDMSRKVEIEAPPPPAAKVQPAPTYNYEKARKNETITRLDL